MRRRGVKNCPHYWEIEEPHGRTSRGVCRWCGAIAEFPNWMPTIEIWGLHDYKSSRRDPFPEGHNNRWGAVEEAV